jgi:D-alanyl-D-alanine carboxypeptidase
MRRGVQPFVRARAAIVMDAKTGELLYAKGPDDRLPPASTTKVMTVVLALESGRLDDAFVVSQVAAATPAVKLYLRTGNRVQLQDLTRAMMLKSANDASVVVAEGLGGSVNRFSARMNRRAFEIGARNTRFVNPNGLPAQGHYSTVRDLALIFKHALSVPGFREIAGADRSIITTWDQKRRRTIHLRNSNRLLRGYRVPVIGKTGYTREAKRCFVGAASADGHEIVVALLGSTDLWGDARRLIDFGLAATPGDRTPPVPTIQVKNETVPPPSRAAYAPSKTGTVPVSGQVEYATLQAETTPGLGETVPALGETVPAPVQAEYPTLEDAAMPAPAQAEYATLKGETVPAPVQAGYPTLEDAAMPAPAQAEYTTAARLTEAPPPPADSDDAPGYSLVLMPADNTRDAAERLRHFVGRRGHHAIVETTGSAESRTYRVRVVGLPSRAAALQAGDELRAEHLQPAIVPPG